MKTIILFVLKPVYFIFRVLYAFFNFLRWLFLYFFNKDKFYTEQYLNKKFDLYFEEYNNWSFEKKEITFLQNSYYEITNIFWLHIDKDIYEYKVEWDFILSRIISLKEWWKYKIKDNTVLISDIKKDCKGNKFTTKEECEKNISKLEKKCEWHQETDCYIKTILYKIILKKSNQYIKILIRQDLEKYKSIKFEFNELLESFWIKYEFDKKEEIYKFIWINKKDDDISEKDIKFTFDTIEAKYWINPHHLNKRIKKISNCIK